MTCRSRGATVACIATLLLMASTAHAALLDGPDAGGLSEAHSEHPSRASLDWMIQVSGTSGGELRPSSAWLLDARIMELANRQGAASSIAELRAIYGNEPAGYYGPLLRPLIELPQTPAPVALPGSLWLSASGALALLVTMRRRGQPASHPAQSPTDEDPV